jgi:hypothetical protein
MMRRAAGFSVALGTALGGCALPHHDVAMRGSADGVIINYFGDLTETLPLARQHCAQYERVPVLRETKDNNAIYDCVRPGAGS